MFRRIAIAILAALLSTFSASAGGTPSYGERLEGFDYPYEVQTFKFTSQGQALEMNYMDIAPAQADMANGRAAVLLHGKNFCGATWETTIKALTGAGFRVVVPDQIGFCKSSKPLGYQFSFNQLAANTRDLISQLGLGKVTLIGHSMGGMLAMRFAMAYPNRIEHLVLVDPLGLEDWQAKGVPYATIDELFAAQLKTTSESIKAYQQRMYYGGSWKPAYDRWVEMQAGMYAGPGREHIAMIQAQTSDMIFNEPIIHELERLDMPVTLMIGMKDRTAPGSNRAPKALAEQLGDYPTLARAAIGRLVHGQLVEFPDLGHSPQVENPERFHTELLRALTR
ncbi:MAG: alpha/beta fold hydrolase [Hyphomicrobium sp.]